MIKPIIKPIIKPVGFGCNLSCVYCYHRKENQSVNDVMNIDTYERILSSLLDYQDEVSIVWHGGEPLLAGYNFYEKVFNISNKFNVNQKKNIKHSIQTNGTILNQKWIDLFKTYNVSISLSVDGPKDIHDSYRKYKNGYGTYEHVISSVALLKKNNMQFGVIFTINNLNVQSAETIWEYIKDNGISYFSINPCLEKDDKNQIEKFSVTPSQFAEFATTLYDLWLENDDKNIIISFFGEVLEGMFSGHCNVCTLSGNCSSFLVFDSKGDVKPCDNFYGNDYHLGNVMQSKLNEIISQPFTQDLFKKLSFISNECKICEWFEICKNGCPYQRNGFNSKYNFCSSNKKIFKHIRESVISNLNTNQ